MTNNTNEFRSLITPVFVLFCGIALVFLAAMILRDPSRAGADLVLLPSTGPQPAELPNPSQLSPTALPSASVSGELAAAEDRLVKNMEFFDSRFERFTADLKVAEEMALSRSDLVGTRYELKSLQDQLEKLRGLTTEWVNTNVELLADTTGQQIAADPELLDDYMQLTDRSRLSQRDVEELTERLEPLSVFIAWLEDQDTVPYEPGERFQTRLVSMNNSVNEAVREYEECLAELRRLMRDPRAIDESDETLQDAIYRWRREHPRKPAAMTSVQLNVPQPAVVAPSAASLSLNAADNKAIDVDALSEPVEASQAVTAVQSHSTRSVTSNAADSVSHRPWSHHSDEDQSRPDQLQNASVRPDDNRTSVPHHRNPKPLVLLGKYTITSSCTCGTLWCRYLRE